MHYCLPLMTALLSSAACKLTRTPCAIHLQLPAEDTADLHSQFHTLDRAESIVAERHDSVVEQMLYVGSRVLARAVHSFAGSQRSRMRAAMGKHHHLVFNFAYSHILFPCSEHGGHLGDLLGGEDHRIENSHQFFSWFAGVEGEMDREQEASYRYQKSCACTCAPSMDAGCRPSVAFSAGGQYSELFRTAAFSSCA